MSVSIGLLGADFSMVCGDDRSTIPIPIKGVKWHDGVEKVFQTPFGFVAASGGIIGVKEFFEKYLNMYVIKTRKDIWKLFCYAGRDCENYIESKGFHSKHICTTRFIYSLNYPQNRALSMDIYTLDYMFQTRRLKSKNTLIVNAPKDTKRIKLLKTKYFEQAKNVKDMHEAVYLVACLIDEMARLTKLISNNVNCGITFKVSENEVVFLKVTENAKTIKKMYKK